MDKDTQQIIDRARAVCASWEQWRNSHEQDRLGMWLYVESGIDRLIIALDDYDQDA